MKVADALRGIKATLRKSDNTYEESETPMVYVNLAQEFHGQDYLVLSETSARNLLSKPAEEQMAFLATCEVTYSDDLEVWGIIMPQSTQVLGEITF
jgi:hypothetical protein